jgi:hypothetical protein
MATLAEIKDWFRTGLKPTQIQFWATWDSFWHKGTPIPQSAVQNLETTLVSLNPAEKRLNYTPQENTSEAQFDELIGMDMDAIAVYNQLFTDGFDFDSKTGTLLWSFEEGVKHLIFYSKQKK